MHDSSYAVAAKPRRHITAVYFYLFNASQRQAAYIDPTAVGTVERYAIEKDLHLF